MQGDENSRLSGIEVRLTRLERLVEALTTQPVLPAPAHANPVDAAPQPPKSPPSAASPPALPPLKAPSARLMSTQARAALPSIEMPALRPGNWLGIVAVLCFILAAGLIVKLSIDSGWLTPARQIGLAALLGFALIGAGLALLKTDREYASYLPGAGVIVLYMATFAAHRYYPLISFPTALAAVSLISGLCIWLYARIRHDVYPVTAAAGAYCAPIVLSLNAGSEFSLYYFLLCSVAFGAISIWVQSRTLTLISAYLAIFVTAVVGLDLHRDLLVACMLALHFLVFSVAAYLYSLANHKALSEQEAWIFLPVLLAFYALEYYYIERLQPGLAPWISLVFAGVLLGLYRSARRAFTDRMGSEALVFTFTTIVAFHSVYLQLLPQETKPWLFVVIILAAALQSQRIPQRVEPRFMVPYLAIIGILGIEYLTMLSGLLERRHDAENLLVCFAALASLWLLILRGRKWFENYANRGNALLAAAHLLAIMALYRLSTDAGSLAVSALWLLYALGVMGLAFSRKDEVMAKSALFVLAFAAGKALLYDAASAPTIVRILCLLLTGAVLYGCGLLMRRIAFWNRPLPLETL